MSRKSLLLTAALLFQQCPRWRSNPRRISLTGPARTYSLLFAAAATTSIVRGPAHAGWLEHAAAHDAEFRHADFGGGLAEGHGLSDEGIPGTAAAAGRDRRSSGQGVNRIVGCADARIAPA